DGRIALSVARAASAHHVAAPAPTLSSGARGCAAGILLGRAMSAQPRGLTSYEKVQRHISLAWYPISVSLVMFGLFSTFGLAAGQVQEALAFYVADPGQPWRSFDWTRAGLLFLGLFVFASTMRYWTARLLGVDLRGLHVRGALNRWQSAFIAIAWFAPWIGAALSLSDAALPFLGGHAEPGRSFGEDAIHLAAALAGNATATPFVPMALASLAFPFLFVLLWWSPLSRFVQRRFGASTIGRGLYNWTLPAAFVAFTILFFAMPAQAIDVASLVDPVP